MQATFQKKLTTSMGWLAALVVLAFLVKTNNVVVTAVDHGFQGALKPLTGPAMTTFVSHLTNLGEPKVALGLAVLVVLYCCWRREWGHVVFGFATIVIGAGFATVMKHIVARPRPVDKLVAETGFSFPSGHCFMTAILVLLILCLLVNRLQSTKAQLVWKVILIAWLIIIMLTRIYLHVHYPTDTFGSILAALFVWNLTSAGYVYFTGDLPGHDL